MKYKIFSLLFIFVIVLNGCHKEKEVKLIVGLSPDYPPFAFEYRNEFIGFDVELTNAICTRLGYKVEFKKMNFEDLFLALENKNVDLIASAVSKTDERMKKFDFSHSYYVPKFALVYKRENSRYVTSIDDVDGAIGVESHTTMADDIKNHFLSKESDESVEKAVDSKQKDIHKTNFITMVSDKKNTKQLKKENDIVEKDEENSQPTEKTNEIKEEKSEEKIDSSDSKNLIKLYNSHSDLLKALEKDEIRAIFTEVLQAEVVTQNDRDLTFIPINDLDGHSYEYGFVFNKNSKLLEKFDKVLDEINSEGKIDILKLRWFSGYGVYNNSGKN